VVVSGSYLLRRLATPLVALTLLFAAASPAAAEDAPRLQWSPRWTKFTTTQYMLTGAMLGASFASEAWLRSAAQPRWRGNVLLDGQARGLLAAGTEAGRERASDVSSVLAYGIEAYPFLIDSVLVAGVLDESYEVAWQMGMIGVQAVLVSHLVTELTKRAVGRARPDLGHCSTGHELACGTTTESFISGHTASAFVGAGLICAQHQNLRLYGSAAAGAITCGASLTAATTVGALRIVADRHHLSDVLAGAAVGLAAGYLLPNLLNYDFGASAAQSEAASGSLVPLATRSTLGIGYVGQF
jgi:membrane-associated phospholipid phosphatase